MKVKNQLKKLQEFLDDDSRKRKHHRRDMRELLWKMKLKERKLSIEARLATDEREGERLKRKIDMLHAQRRKGIQALRSIPG